MHGAVRELEANMEQMSLSQQYANRGIYILCKARPPPLPRQGCSQTSACLHNCDQLRPRSFSKQETMR